MDLDQQFLDSIETHSVEGIRAALDAGLDARGAVRGKPPVDWLIQMYTRSDRFPACLRLLLERGATVGDPFVEQVLLDDAEGVEALLASEPALLGSKVTLVSAFTPLVGASPLHVACEYGNLDVARTLLEKGADADARADRDRFGLDGHTPLFHTVNSNENRSLPLLRLLLEAGASIDVRLPGITWGRGFEWETTLFDVTPVSYAQMGLLPQMHRRETDVYANVRLLLEAAGREVPPLENVPNQYLRGRPG